MSQNFVTGRDVAAEAGASLQYHDPQRILERLDEALAKEGYRKTDFSLESISTLQLAWAVASHQHSIQVTVHHLAYALVCKCPQPGKALAENLESDPESLAAGCILKALSCGYSSDGTDLVSPSVDATRWLGAALTLALRRGRTSELQPDDLQQVVAGREVLQSVRKQLRSAAVAGKRREIILGQRSEPLPTSPSEIVEQLEDIHKGKTEAGTSAELASLTDIWEDFEERYSSETEVQKLAFTSVSERLANIEDRVLLLSDVSRRLETVASAASATDSRLTAIEKQVRSLEDVPSRLGVIDDHVVTLGKSLPRPPSGIRLSAAIIAVLALGVIAGHGLTTLQINSPDVSTVVANEK